MSQEDEKTTRQDALIPKIARFLKKNWAILMTILMLLSELLAQVESIGANSVFQFVSECIKTHSITEIIQPKENQCKATSTKAVVTTEAPDESKDAPLD